jgi:hypothetical protein
MANFRGEDKKLQREAEGLVAKYNEILKIFSNIANSTA